MATADQLLELMFSWIEQRERCAEQLRKLALELESLRENCNASECVGSSVAVLGAISLIGAGAASFLTAGAAAPFLGVLGAAYTGIGVTVSLATKITEHFISSDAMKEAQKIEKKSNKTAEKIQKLFQQLKLERKKASSSADPDDLDRHVMTEILRAMARRSGLKWEINACMVDEFFSDAGPRFMRLNLNFIPALTTGVIVGLIGILAFFAFKASGKKSKLVFAKGAQQLIKVTSTTGFKTALKGGAMVVGGAVGLAFELPEAIDNWKEMIKNNHVTEASQSLKDTANTILETCRTLRKRFNDIKATLDEMAKRQQDEKLNKDKIVSLCKMVKRMVLCSLVLFLFWSVCLVFSSRTDKTMSSNPAQEDFRDQNIYAETQTDQLNQHQDSCFGQEQKSDSSINKESNHEFETNQRPPAAIKVGLLNVRSMNNKPEKILELITQNKLDVFLTTETWLREDTADKVLREASPENFNFCFQAREGKKGGGVAIQFLEELQGEQIHLDFITTFEYVVTVLKHDEWDEPIVFINVYLPPGYNKEQFKTFLDEFEDFLKAFKNHTNLIVTGDFNIKVDPDKRSFTDEFYHLLPLYGLDQHVEEPTHNRGNTLDLVMTRNVEISNLFVQDDGISDHSTVYFNARPMSKDTRKKTKENMEQDEQAKRFKKTEE